jgi:hypothetical protein
MTAPAEASLSAAEIPIPWYPDKWESCLVAAGFLVRRPAGGCPAAALLPIGGEQMAVDVELGLFLPDSGGPVVAGCCRCCRGPLTRAL